jgi:mono/diheme cytochrome c family protein
MRTVLAVTVSLVLSVSLGFGQEPATKIKKVPTAYTQPNGPEMFESYCAPCHGKDGKGTGPAASALKKAPADLTLLAQKNGGKYPELRVQEFIRGDSAPAAHGSRDMPMWGELFRSLGGGNQEGLAAMRVKNLSSYIAGIQAK